MSTENILDETPSPQETAFVAVRRLTENEEFFDVNTVATIKQSAALKAAMVDEMKPVWAEKHPVVRIAEVKMIEVNR